MNKLATIAVFALMLSGLWLSLAVVAARTTSSFSSTPLQTKPEPVSPRLADLRKELENGNRSALEQFWQQVTSQGTPIIEPIQADDKNLAGYSLECDADGERGRQATLRK